MHILFIHPNFPAQFGHVGGALAARLGWRSTFLSLRPPARSNRSERIQYRVPGGATQANHHCTRAFENSTRHALGAYQALKARPDVRPELIVGHSGFGTTLFLKELYPDVPVVNYFEYFYRTRGADMDFRPDFPADERDRRDLRFTNGSQLVSHFMSQTPGVRGVKSDGTPFRQRRQRPALAVASELAEVAALTRPLFVSPPGEGRSFAGNEWVYP
jgi:hypothetical protein